MRRRRTATFLTILIISYLFSACSQSVNLTGESEPTQDFDIAIAESIQRNNISGEYSKTDDSYKTVAENLFVEFYPDIVIEKPPVLKYTATGRINENSETVAMIFCMYDERVPFNPTVLVIESDEGAYGFDLGEVADVNMILADIDGNDLDEIILHIDLGGNGSSSDSFDSKIYRIEDRKLIPVFESSHASTFDSGFRISVMDNYMMNVQNEITGDSWTFEGDRTRAYPADEVRVGPLHLFDENGNVLDNYKGQIFPNIDSGNFKSIKVADVDEDGQLEILTEEMVILISRYHFEEIVGIGFNAIKYDLANGQIKVVKSDFVVLSPEKTFSSETQTYLDDYRDNWYSN